MINIQLPERIADRKHTRKMQDAALSRASFSTVSILTTCSNNGSSQCCRGFPLADDSIPTNQPDAVASGDGLQQTSREQSASGCRFSGNWEFQ